jgi:hypothetical protein
LALYGNGRTDCRRSDQRNELSPPHSIRPCDRSGLTRARQCSTSRQAQGRLEGIPVRRHRLHLAGRREAHCLAADTAAGITRFWDLQLQALHDLCRPSAPGLDGQVELPLLGANQQCRRAVLTAAFDPFQTSRRLIWWPRQRAEEATPELSTQALSPSSESAENLTRCLEGPPNFSGICPLSLAARQQPKHDR